MKAVYLKEFKSFFNSVLGYAFCAVMIALIGIYFMANNLSYGYPNFSYSLRNGAMVMMYAIPLLTMKSFAEERKTKTDQMLLTCPLKLYQIVIGKFLAYATIYAIPMLLSCVCPLIIKKMGTYSALKSDYIAILFMFVYGLIFIAIGMFISSLTDNIIISAVISFAMVFVIVMWGSLMGYIPDTAFASLITLVVILTIICALIYGITKSGFAVSIVLIGSFIALISIYYSNSKLLINLVKSIITTFNFSTPLTNVMYYFVFDLNGLFMYISTIFIFIMLTIQSLHKRRWN